MLGELADEVYTVEIVPALLETAKKKLEELKEKGTLHYKKIVAVTADGSKGYPPGAPYDAIIVTAAPRRVPVELLNQLKPGGRLVIPVGEHVRRRFSRDRPEGVGPGPIRYPPQFSPHIALDRIPVEVAQPRERRPRSVTGARRSADR